MGVGLGFGVGGGGNIGVGFGFGVGAEIGDIACALAVASSCRFFNSSASLLSCCFCTKKTQPSATKIAAKIIRLSIK